MGTFTSFNEFVQQQVIITERMALRERLLLQSDAVLARKGYSRKLIEEGLSAWPWRVATSLDGNPGQHDNDTSSTIVPSDWIRQAARALRKCTGQVQADQARANSADTDQPVKHENLTA